MTESQSQKQENPKKSTNDKESKGLHEFGRYSGIVFQMIIVILVLTWCGIKLDKILGTTRPVFTAIFSLLGVFAGIYIAVRDFIK